MVRNAELPLDYKHGKYALRQILEVDVGKVASGAGMGRRRSSRRKDPEPSHDGSGKGQDASGDSENPSAPDVRRMLFLDTETTGLGGPGTYVFLVGMGYVEDDAFVVEQHFIRSPDEEAAMLQVIAETLPQWPVMTTFNGVSFDLPLLRARMKAHDIQVDLRNILHCDLIYGARRLWQRQLPNCRLQTLEKYILDLKRQGDVPSGEVPGLYLDYLESGEIASIEAVFHHNVLDIISLAGLMIAMHEHAAESSREGGG